MITGRRKLEAWWLFCIARERSETEGNTNNHADLSVGSSLWMEDAGEPADSRPLRRRALVMDHNSRRITDAYNLEKVIGKGGFGVVRKAHMKDCAGITRAIKEVRKRDMRSNLAVRKEASILQSLDHPCICRLFETFEDEKNIYLVLEFIEGKELFQEVIASLKDNRFDEPRYAAIMGRVFGALHYLHRHAVLHRDLKPENIMVCQPSRDSSRPNIKIIDFGLAVLTETSKSYSSNTQEGTHAYLAPEAMTEGKFTFASDMWSAGIIIFVIFQGRFPDCWEVQIAVQSVRSDKARNLLQSLLQADPRQRPTAADAMRHPWVRDAGSLPPNSSQQCDLSNSVQSFVEFYQSDKLQRAALTAVASQITGDQIDAMWDQFRLVDTEGNGVITKDDLTRAFEAAPPDHVKDITTWAEALFEELDSDGLGKLEFTEWVAAALRSSSEISDSAMLAAFRSIDVDNTGNISLNNLSRVIRVSNEELEDIMARADLNGDGVIDFEDFKAVLTTVAPRLSPRDSQDEPLQSPRSPLGIPAAVRMKKWVPRSTTPRFGGDTRVGDG